MVILLRDCCGSRGNMLTLPCLRNGTLPPVLILSVCAISARFSSHPKLATNPNFLRGEEWASHARDIVMRRYEWPNITILPCLLMDRFNSSGTDRPTFIKEETIKIQLPIKEK